MKAKVWTAGLIALGVVLAMTAPLALAQTDQADALAGTQWQLVSYGAPGAETPALPGSSVTLAFESGGEVTGHGGCNGYSGGYAVEDVTLTFSQVVSTLMACADAEVNRQEQVYFEALQSAQRFELVGDQLTIWYDDGQRLNFVRTDAPGGGQVGQPVEPFEDVDSPVGLLASYYNAINRQDYQRAYGYWETPAEPFDQFASGFADTVSARVIIEPPMRYEGAAGSLYASIPTVLIAQRTDGTQATFSGCFVARRPNLRPPDISAEQDVWRLYSADLVEVPNDSAIPLLLSQACAQ
ncbi:MAG: META domain-containing protein [Chloroflexi bacterium]|nr:META domain-containing protein [Chloroflexota bacterium]